MKGQSGAHTVNEKAVSTKLLFGFGLIGPVNQSVDDLVEFTRFYQAIILNMDQATEVA